MDSKRFIELLSNIGCGRHGEEIRARRYSGRAMYGRQCVGIDTDDQFKAIASITAEVAWAGGEDMMEDWVELLAETRMDSMGRGVILYWPDLEWPADAGVQVHVGDYVRKDGDLCRVERVQGGEVFTSDGGVMALSELSDDDIVLESEVGE
jgi:hypothetical protein